MHFFSQSPASFPKKSPYSEPLFVRWIILWKKFVSYRQFRGKINIRTTQVPNVFQPTHIFRVVMSDFSRALYSVAEFSTPIIFTEDVVRPQPVESQISRSDILLVESQNQRFERYISIASFLKSCPK